MKKSRVSQFLISTILSIFLLTNLFLPKFVIARENPSKPVSINSLELKIDNKLIQQFKDNEQITFLLKFKDQADTNKIAIKAKETAKKQKLTAAKTELIVRSAVVSTLRNTAIETQDSVLAYLEQAKQNGEVDNVESFYIVNAISVTGTKKVMDKLATYPEVAKILPNETRQLITPIRKKVVSEKSSSSIEWGVERVGAPQAWKMGINGSGIVVANIDTGVQWDHPALKEKYRGYNSSNPSEVNHSLSWFDAVNGMEVPYDDLKHGTHTMGTIVGSEPDESNQIGVAPGAKWIAVKAFSEGGGTDVDLLEAGEWILAPKDADGNLHPELAPDIVNNSWGGGPGLDEWYRPMVQNWRSGDIFPVFAAGNNGAGGPGWISVPANYPESFAVAATDSNNKLTYFSSRGPGPYEESKPNVSAPGDNIRSATPTNDYEDGWSGTSMATPHISGVIALIKQANASLSIEQIEKLLEDTAIPLTDTEYPTSPNYGYGYGFVNAYNAIESIQKGNAIIKGYIHYNGVDQTKPTHEHTPPSFVYAKEDIPLTIQVQDNISLKSVKLTYQVNGEQKIIDAVRIAGDYKNGTYQAKAPGVDVNLNKFTYQWLIEDYAKNQVITNFYEIEVKPGITLGYIQNFETTPEGWYSEGFNNDWELGIPTKEPDKAFNGEKVYATNLEGEHNPISNSYLHMPPIDLPESKNMFLSFKHWYDFDPSGVGGPTDYGALLISTDKQNWEILSKTEPVYDEDYNAHYSSDGWIDGEVNLSAYAGKRIYITFYMQAQDWGFDTVRKSGWAIDDISLIDTSLLSNKKQETMKLETHLINDMNKLRIIDSVKTKPNEPISQELPIGAQVSIVESGYSVSSNPADGSYIMNHNPGNFTIRAEAYGFHSKDQSVTIPKDGVIEANLILEPIAKGTIEGVVKDQETGKPLSNAVISLVEDATISPVRTDNKGRFTLTAFEGNYTLHVFKPDYVYKDISIFINSKNESKHKIDLQKYIGFTGEIGYDDGTGEESWFWLGTANNGFAVKMSLDKSVSKSWLTGGLFKVNTEFPSPGSTRFQVAVYDSSGVNGAPGKKIAGPFDAHARTDDQWTFVDLADKNIFVSGDFYLTYIQPDPSSYKTSTSLYSDLNGTFHDRNWFLYNGIWTQNTDPIYGNMMIRAVVNNSLPVPVIESPLNNSVTKESKVDVKGKATPSSTVIIQNNGKDIASGVSKEDGSFTIPVKLKNGENKITAVTVTKDGRTDLSEAVKIILDKK